MLRVRQSRVRAVFLGVRVGARLMVTFIRDVGTPISNQFRNMTVVECAPVAEGHLGGGFQSAGTS